MATYNDTVFLLDEGIKNTYRNVDQSFCCLATPFTKDKDKDKDQETAANRTSAKAVKQRDA
ncbi:hypothetical protein VPNG_00063 [Cytospora leucostoma]|uniref:Uncharacterized protein n=1 Tax=Cytospora leucostoma TaxID=1230097 RepID=A0A423XN63_9PEZI|nr:hypothetical protein VPNG_00063 [Cytospora leucostoma]